MNTRFSPVGTLAAMLLLAACGTAPQNAAIIDADGQSTSAAVDNDRQGSQAAIDGPRGAPGGDPFRRPRPDDLAALTPAPATPTLPAPQNDLRKRLVGLSGEAVENLLGRPSFQRRDPPARIWQYRVSQCVLDLFLYEDGKALTVRHVEARGRHVTAPALQACFDELLRQAAAKTG